MRTLYPLGDFKYKALQDLQRLAECLNHPKSAEISKRISIITFFDKHGHKVTKEAYNVCRSTVYNWKRALALGGGRLVTLASGSKTPVNKRRRQINPAINGFIVDYRSEHPKVGQATIKPHLDAYCRRAGISTISLATI
jgi:hypothetical protein